MATNKIVQKWHKSEMSIYSFNVKRICQESAHLVMLCQRIVNIWHSVLCMCFTVINFLLLCLLIMTVKFAIGQRPKKSQTFKKWALTFMGWTWYYFILNTWFLDCGTISLVNYDIRMKIQFTQTASKTSDTHNLFTTW